MPSGKIPHAPGSPERTASLWRRWRATSASHRGATGRLVGDRGADCAWRLAEFRPPDSGDDVPSPGQIPARLHFEWRALHSAFLPGEDGIVACGSYKGRRSTGKAAQPVRAVRDPQRKTRGDALRDTRTEPIGEPLKCFDENLRNIWAEIVTLVPPGSMVRSDCFWLELVCRLLTEARAGLKDRGKLRLLRKELGVIDLEISADHRTLMRKTPASKHLM